MQHTACINMRNKHYTAHILYIRHMFRRRVQLYFKRHSLPVRLLKWKMQQRSVFKHDLQQPAAIGMRNKHYTKDL